MHACMMKMFTYLWMYLLIYLIEEAIVGAENWVFPFCGEWLQRRVFWELCKILDWENQMGIVVFFFFFLYCLVKVLYRWSRPWGWKEIIGCFRSIVYSWGLKGVCNKREEKVGEIRRKKKGQISILVFKIFLKIFKNYL